MNLIDLLLIKAQVVVGSATLYIVVKGQLFMVNGSPSNLNSLCQSSHPVARRQSVPFIPCALLTSASYYRR